MDGLQKLTNALSNGTIRDPLRPPLPRNGGFATPTQNCNLKFRTNECRQRNNMAYRMAYRSPTLFRMVPSPTPYGLAFLEIGGLQLSYPSYTATDFNFGWYVQRANLNKSLLKIFEKRERGRIQRLPKFFWYPQLSQERKKLRTSNFVGTFIGSIQTKAREIMLEIVGLAVGVVREFRNFQGTHVQGALRGHLCDSTAFLFEISLLNTVVRMQVIISIQRWVNM